MNAALRRGACPSLSAPMQTGDGLLVRLSPSGGALSARELAGVAAAAARFGNGILEITARGSLQIRGLTEVSARALGDEIDALGIRAATGIDIRTGPLAGIDAAEIADPRPVARAVEAGVADLEITKRLAPKTSVIVDGGGALGLGELIADVRIEALSVTKWLVRIGGTAATARTLGKGDARRAAVTAIAILSKLAECGPEARGRDLAETELAELVKALDATDMKTRTSARLPVGRFALRSGGIARGFALPFGQIEADALVSLANAAGSERSFRLAPGRGLLALGLDGAAEAELVKAAERLGLVIRIDDPRLAIVACAGAPACASAHLATKAIARMLAAERAASSLDAKVHISGCGKQCARPAGPSITIVGGADGYEIVSDGAPGGIETRQLLARVADAQGASRRKQTA